MSVRITAAGVVAVALMAFFTAPVSACDERFIKRCEKASAAAAVAADAAAETPAVKRGKSARRVTVVISRSTRSMRFAKRTKAPGFATRGERSMTLASAESRMVGMPRESALSRRFRGFIDPQPISQNAFEALRRPHLVAENLEPPISATMTDGTETADAAPSAPAARPVAAAAVAAQAPAAAPAPAVTTAKQDRVAPKAATMELASAESRPVVLPEPPAPARASMFSANAAPAPAPAPVVQPQTVLTEAASAPAAPPQSPFSFHHLVIALCGALGAAGALRFVVGA